MEGKDKARLSVIVQLAPPVRPFARHTEKEATLMKTNDDRSTTREFYKLPSGATLTRRPTGFPNRANKYMDSRRRRRVWRRWGRRGRRRRSPLPRLLAVFPSLCNCITNVHLFCQPVFCIITSRALGPLPKCCTRKRFAGRLGNAFMARTDGRPLRDETSERSARNEVGQYNPLEVQG